MLSSRGPARGARLPTLLSRFTTLGRRRLRAPAAGSAKPQGTEMHRVFFLAADDRRALEQVDRQCELVRAHFFVRFKNAHSADVSESYAIASDGGLFGIS